MNLKNYKFLDKIKDLPCVDELWLFGSRARGDNQDRSDIDLAILCPNATNSDWLEIINIVEEADTLLKIDYVRFDEKHISKDLYNNILRDRKVI